MNRHPGELSSMLLKHKVGFVRIDKPQKYHQLYEYAAWWTDWLSDTGDFDVFLGQSAFAPYELNVWAKIPATVTGNNLAPHFGGVAYGKGEDHTGERGTMPVSARFLEAAAGQANKEGIKFVISVSNLDAAIENAESYLREYANGFPKWYKDYQHQPRSDYHTTIGMVAHYGSNMEYYGRVLQEILRQKEYRTGQFKEYELVQELRELTPA